MAWHGPCPLQPDSSMSRRHAGQGRHQTSAFATHSEKHAHKSHTWRPEHRGIVRLSAADACNPQNNKTRTTLVVTRIAVQKENWACVWGPVMPNNGSSSSGHVQWLCVHVEVCMQPFESASMCVQCSLVTWKQCECETTVHGWHPRSALNNKLPKFRRPSRWRSKG